MSFWENQLQKVKEGKSPALTIEQQQEREKPELAMQENKPVEQAAQTDDGVGFGDVAKAAAAGVVENVQSKAEMVRLQDLFLTQHPTLGTLDLVPEARKFVEEKQRGVKESIGDFKSSIEKSMSEEAQLKLENEFINENLEFTDNAKQLSSWTLKATKVIANMVPDLIAGGLVGRGLYQSAYDTAFKAGIGKGLSEAGAKIAANKVANAAMMVPTAVASTMTAQGSSGVQVRQTIENLPWKDLAQSDTFKQSFAQINADPSNAEMSNKDKLNLARTMTAEAASKDIIDDPALLTVNALASFIGDATLGKMIAGKMSGGIASKVIRGAVAEGATEAPQGAMEHYAQNLTLIDVAGQDIAPSKGVAKSFVEGGLMGAVIGGGMGGGSGAVDAFTGRPSEGTPTETIPTEDVTAETDIVPTEEKSVAQRREELEQRLEQQREEARKEQVISGEGEAQKALAAGKVSPTAEELIQAAPSQPKETPMEYGLNRATIMQKEMDEFIQGRKAPTVAERRANLEKRLEQQRAEMDRQRIETGTGEVQARLSRPAEPTAEELILKAPEESGPTPGELEFRRQSDRNYIEQIKDAKIPQGLKGKPNAVKMMNLGYRNALSDFGGLSKRMAKTTGPSAETDTMSDAIAKMGGLSRKAAEAEGFDPAMFKGSKTFSAKGKMTFDDAAESLNELGFTNRESKPLDSNDVVEMLYGEANNAEVHYSNLVNPEMMTGDAQLTRSWAKQLGGADKLNIAVQKALNNEPLGKRQADVIEDMLDTINIMRSEGAEQAKEKLQQTRIERADRRVNEFNTLINDAIGRKDHLQDAQAYADMLNEMPDTYTEEQVILDELVSTAGDIDFASTTEAIDQYEAGSMSLPTLLTKLSDITEKRVKTYAEAKPAIQAVSKPTTQPVEGVVTERVAESEGSPAAGRAEVTKIDQRQDGSTTTVSDGGLTLLHGSPKSVINIDDVQIVRTGQKQGKKGRLYGGFYTTSEEDIEQAKGYAGMSEGTPTIHNVRIKAGTKVLNKIGDITRLSENYINELTSQGYGLVVGKDPRGRTEYVVIDKNTIDSISSMDSVKEKTLTEAKPAIQKISEPTTRAVETVVAERAEPITTAPAAEPVAERADAETERAEPVTEQLPADDQAKSDLEVISKLDEIIKARIKTNQSEGAKKPSLKGVRGDYLKAGLSNKQIDEALKRTEGYTDISTLESQIKNGQKTKKAEVQVDEIVQQLAPEVGETLSTAFDSENIRILNIVNDEVKSGFEPKNNNDLKVIASKVFEVEKASDVSANQLKIIQEAFETVSIVNRRKNINALISVGKGSAGSVKLAYIRAVKEYESQPNLDVLTGKSSDLQAYSTPTPMALLANLAAGIDSNTSVYEPTAGNGLLLVLANPKFTIANELDPIRASSLAWTGFDVTVNDATANNIGTKVDAILANPPFGPMPKNENGERPTVTFEDYRGKVVNLKEIDHVIARNALEAMKDDGKATLIIGASMNEPGVYKGNKKAFLNWLYSNYNVKHHIEVDGSMYTGQGASFPTQMIVIDGRVRSGTGKFAPIPGIVKRIKGWTELYENFKESGLLSTNGKQFNGQPKGNGVVYPNVTSDTELRGSISKPAIEPRISDLSVKRDREAGLVKSTELGGTGSEPIGKPTTGTVGSQPDISKTGMVGSANILSGDTTTDSTIGQPKPVRLPVTATGEPKGVNNKVAPKQINTKVDKANNFQAHYKTASNGFNEGVLTPNNMASYTQAALADIQTRYGSVDQLVIDKLGYQSADEMHKAFMGLQTDSIALAIDNIENGRAIIIGDQTGVGKGRQAAGIIRYAIQQGKIPVFISQKPNLFTDMYDDLADIGVENFKPLIMNNNNGFVSKGGERLFNHTDSKRSELIKQITSDSLPEGYSGLFLTYSQISSDSKGVKTGVLNRLAKNAIIIMDESHSAAGDSKTGGIFQDLVNQAFGVTYLSATYAKRPDNMMLYMRTDLGLATDNRQSLLDAVTAGGLGMQTYIAGKLAEAGQMVRRERSFDGINIKSRVIEDKGGSTANSFDKATSVLRTIQDVSAMWANYVETSLADQIQIKHGLDTSVGGNKADKNINITSFSSVVHNNIAQLALGLKARDSARMALEALAQGKSPVIALDNTLGSALQTYMADNGLSVGDNASDLTYASVLRNALEGVLSYSVKEPGSDKSIKFKMPISEIADPSIQAAYKRAIKGIAAMGDENIPGSPIDAIRDEIQKAGKSVAEITGRNVMIDYSNDSKIIARPASEMDRRAVVDRFNNGTLDVLILNQAGSTGLSIHASNKFINQKPRHMIVVQPSLDINTYMQMLGRTNRTGQIELPSYDNVWLNLPSEKRPAAVLSRKMSSLNANTSGNTESATSVDSVDLLNPYGDQVVKAFVDANMDYLSQFSSKLTSVPDVDAAIYFLGKLAVLPVNVQEEVLGVIESEYKDLITYLDSTGQNELNMTEMDLDAKPLSQLMVSEKKKGAGVFSDPVYLTKVNAKAIGKSPTWAQVNEALAESSQDNFNSAISQAAKDTEYRKRLVTRLEELKQRRGELASSGKDIGSIETSINEQEVRIADFDSSQLEIKNLFGAGGSYAYGSYLNVVLEEDVPAVPAVIVGLDYRHEGGNPYSDSKWKMKLMVADRIAKIDVSLSRAKKGVVQGKRWDSDRTMESRFNLESEKPARENRYVMTGNLVEAQTISNMKGQIKPITLADGRIIQAMVLPRSFDPVDGVSKKLTATPSQVSNWLAKTEKEYAFLGISNNDNSVTIRRSLRDESVYVVDMPKSVSKGKMYWANPAIEDVIGKQAVKGSGSLSVSLTESEMKRFVKAMDGISPLAIKNQAQISNFNQMAGKKEKEFESKKIVFSKYNAGGSTPKGVSIKEGQLITQSFLKSYKGAAGIKVTWFKTQAEAMDYLGIDDSSNSTFPAAYDPRRNEVVMIAENMDSVSDIKTNLRHEILTHHGLMKVVGQEEWSNVINLVNQSRQSKELSSIWAEVDRDYDGFPENAKAEEVIAKISESEPGAFGEWRDRIISAIVRALRNVGLVGDKISKAEIRDMIRVIGERFRTVGRGESRINNDISFSRQNNGSTLKDSEVAVTHSGGKIDEINKGGIFSGLFASYGEESFAGVNLEGNQTTFAINKDKIASSGDKDLDYKSSITFLKKQYPDFNQDQIDTLYEWVAEDAADPWSDNILENEGYDDPGEASWEAQRLRGQLAIDQGFDAVEMKDETGISILIPYGSKARIMNRDYSLQDEKVKFRRRANNDPWAAENKKLREEDKTLWQQGKNILKRNLTPEGLLPNKVFFEKIKRDSEFEAVEFIAKHLVSNFDKAIMKAYKMSFDYLPQATKNKLNEALSGRVANDIAPEVKASIIAMRQSIDGLSGDYINNIMDKMASEMAVNGRVSAADEALLTRISDNIGAYVNRSYKAFDDPNWFKKVPVETVNAARDYFVQRYIDDGETESEAKRLSNVVVSDILKNGTAYDSMESFVAEGKLGAKDLSILMRRKVIDPEIRALLGEYDDPRINYVKSATKMGRLVWNERFLNRVLDIGMGSFLFKENDRPANTRQIAGEQSETYSPLNGLWTFPEVEQAFKDSMGREQMSDLYRFIVRSNGAVKYGKTVLSPTTAMRNFQSAMFFALANGHFNLSKIKDAMAAVRVQVTGKATAADIGYFVKLKRLGVVYDAPYAKEMARLLGDSEVENMLSSKFGDGAMKSFTKLNDFAQSFYSFGDDFWKIVGFENEKASLLDAGMSVGEAEMEAAKRIRNTYPTYSMTGKAIKWLSRFPLAGTFVSFPAEIIRTSINMIKTANSDIKSSNPKMRALGYKRIAGMAFVSSAFFALNAATKAILGVTDDEEEAIRDLSAPWQKNSTFAYVGRDEKNNLQYFDMSFLDPYGYFKRPITAMLRDQPWQDAAVSALSDLISPFLGADIVAQSIYEVFANKKSSGGQVYNEDGMAGEQLEDISVHLGKTVAPGFIGNAVRTYKALDGQVSSSGKPYKFEEEMLSLVGWRLSTMDPKTSLHYKTFEFSDGLKNANRTIMKQIQDVNKVSDDDLMSAYESAKKQHDNAFKQMIRLTSSAKNSGMTKAAIFETLKRSGVSDDNAKMVIAGKTPPFKLSKASAENAIKKAKVSIGSEHSSRVRERVIKVMKQ